eukprot:UN22866
MELQQDLLFMLNLLRFKRLKVVLSQKMKIEKQKKKEKEEEKKKNFYEWGGWGSYWGIFGTIIMLVSAVLNVYIFGTYIMMLIILIHITQIAKYSNVHKDKQTENISNDTKIDKTENCIPGVKKPLSPNINIFEKKKNDAPIIAPEQVVGESDEEIIGENYAEHNEGYSHAHYQGVEWIEDIHAYLAYIDIADGENLLLGYFNDPLVAAQTYDKNALDLLGPGVKLNFPDMIDPNCNVRRAVPKPNAPSIYSAELPHNYNPSNYSEEYPALQNFSQANRALITTMNRTDHPFFVRERNRMLSMPLEQNCREQQP